MSIDLEKLTRAPWEATKLNWKNEDAGFDRYIHGDVREDDEDCSVVATSVAIVKGNATSGTIQDANADFIALARNAFDVMIRRGWWAELFTSGKWRLSVDSRGGGGEFWDWCSGQYYADPFTALVEADKWYKANIEKVVTP